MKKMMRTWRRGVGRGFRETRWVVGALRPRCSFELPVASFPSHSKELKLNYRSQASSVLLINVSY